MMTDQNASLKHEMGDVYSNETRSVLIYPYGKKRIPLFLEFLLAITRLLVIVSAVLVAVLSVIAKASLVDIAIRVVISILVLGLLGILINWMVGRRYISSAVLEMKEMENESQGLENSSQIET